MRIIMLLGSLAMMGVGIFCFANGSAAFISVAFIIGVLLSIMGFIELVIGIRIDYESIRRNIRLTSDGIAMFFFGIVLLSGQVTDDFSAQMLFALWLLIESSMFVNLDGEDLISALKIDGTYGVISLAMAVLGLYMFFNTRLMNINAIILIGAGMLLLGLRRFTLSFDIVYSRPGFLTGNKERLDEAIEDEKKALAKAKEGIREQKEAQKRIDRIKEEMAQERNVLTEATLRKQNSAAENE